MKAFLQFFEYAHLPPSAHHVGLQFRQLAHELARILPANPESTVAIRKLMEAKDCAVRAVLFKSEN